jgi:hypothetical protein
VQVLEHEQHRRGGRVAGEQGQRLLEDLELGTRGGGGGPRAADRPQGLGQRLVGQLGADEVDRPAEQGLPAGLAGAAGDLGGEAGLADAGLAGYEDGCAAARPRGGERLLERPELGGAACERLGARLHAASIARLPSARKALVGIPRAADKEPGGTR